MGESAVMSAAYRVGINAHLLSGRPGYRRAGIHTYIQRVLTHLPRPADDLEYLVFTRPDAGLPAEPGFQLALSRWPTHYRLVRIAWEQLAWPLLAARRSLSLLHSMAFVTPFITPAPAVVTVYDLSFMRYPEQFPRRQRAYLASQTRRSCRQAQRLIVISESARQDLHRFFQVPLSRIDVVRPGVDALYRPLAVGEIEAFRRARGLPDEFVLHVGTLQPRKNIPVLLEALALLRRPDLKLVLVGGRGWLYEEIFTRIVDLGLERQVRFAGYVPDEELPLWYNSASLLAFPSLYEGFGMPIIEAMACGTAVVAADAYSLAEAGGKAACYFPARDAGLLADRMANVLNDRQLRTTMQEEGKAQAARFSWPRAGRETLAVYHRALQTT